MTNLPTFTDVHVVQDERDPTVTYYLHGVDAVGEFEAEPLDREEAVRQVRDEELLAPHFYRLARKNGVIEFWVPDCGEYLCRSEEEATQKLRQVIADLWGIGA